MIGALGGTRTPETPWVETRRSTPTELRARDGPPAGGVEEVSGAAAGIRTPVTDLGNRCTGPDCAIAACDVTKVVDPGGIGPLVSCLSDRFPGPLEDRSMAAVAVHDPHLRPQMGGILAFRRAGNVGRRQTGCRLKVLGHSQFLIHWMMTCGACPASPRSGDPVMVGRATPSSHRSPRGERCGTSALYCPTVLCITRERRL